MQNTVAKEDTPSVSHSAASSWEVLSHAPDESESGGEGVVLDVSHSPSTSSPDTTSVGVVDGIVSNDVTYVAPSEQVGLGGAYITAPGALGRTPNPSVCAGRCTTAVGPKIQTPSPVLTLPPVIPPPMGGTGALLPTAATLGMAPVAAATTLGTVAVPVVETATQAAAIANAASNSASDVRHLADDIKDIVHSIRPDSPVSTTNSSIPSSAGALHRQMQQLAPPSPTEDAALITLRKHKQLPAHPSLEPLPPTQEGSVRIKLGDNSLETTLVTPSLLAECSLPAAKGADFVRVYSNRVANSHGAFTVVNHNVMLNSHIYSCEVGGRIGPGVNQQMTAFQTLAAGVLPEDRATLTINLGPASKNGVIDDAILSPFMNGGVVSERFVTSALQPKMVIANMHAARALSEFIPASTTFCDNFMLYAKLFFNALLIDVYETVNIGMAAQAFPDGHDVTFINLDDANLDYQGVAALIQRGAITFIDRLDWSDQDNQITNWLAKGGCRIMPAPEGATPAATYVNWPGFDIAVLRHGPALAEPGAALVTSAQLMGFASRMASRRGEWASALRGLYFAFDILGVRYHSLPNVDNARFHFLTSTLSYHSPTMPTPHDYNVLLRALDIRPQDSIDDRREVEELIAQTATNRAYIAALYTGFLGSLSTTLLYGANITTQHLIQYGNAVAGASPTMVAVLANFSNRPPEANAEPAMLCQVKKAFTVFAAARVPTGLYVLNDWLGPMGQAGPGVAAALAGQPNGYTPRLGNPLGIDSWLTVRPLEWGLSGPNTTIDLAKEMVDAGNPAARGWRSVRGSALYTQRATSDAPIWAVMYGVQVLNAILNDFRPVAPPPQFTYSQGVWSPGCDVEWTPPGNAAFGQGEYIAGLHTLQPCTVMTYDYANDAVMAPALTHPALGDGARRRLCNWRGGLQSQVGFHLSPEAAIPAGAFTRTLNLAGMFSRMTTSAAPPAGDTPADSATVNPS